MKLLVKFILFFFMGFIRVVSWDPQCRACKSGLATCDNILDDSANALEWRHLCWMFVFLQNTYHRLFRAQPFTSA